MNVRRAQLGLARRTGLRDRVALADPFALAHEDRPQVGERRLVSVSGHDRHRQAVAGHRPRKRDFAGCRCSDLRVADGRDVDAAMLPGGVAVVAEGEAA
jgi:hypothetical protein